MNQTIITVVNFPDPGFSSERGLLLVVGRESQTVTTFPLGNRAGLELVWSETSNMPDLVKGLFEHDWTPSSNWR